ncbi:MAG: ferritin-like domain-containing protein, partial [Thermoleophilaceae bacterium]|nr:ferritin-like domain-containing protein [Thermoleophilaceae bacterium]
MSDLIKLELVDVDGQVREAADGITEGNRRDFMRRAGIAGAGFVAGGVLFTGLVSPAEAAISTRRKSKANDVKILNYALTLEFLEAAFYKEANASGAIKDPVVAQFAKVTGAHENAHVSQLKKVLGSAAVKEGKYKFGATVTDEAEFKKTAQVLEDTGVSAYAGQGPNILQKPVVVAALSIHSVEARHAAWIRFINSGGMGPEATLPAPVSFDKAK